MSDEHKHDQDHNEDQSRRIANALEAIECDLNLIARSLAEIANQGRATKLSLIYTLKGGTIMGNPVTGTVGNVFDPTVVESNPTTPSIQPIGPLAYASDNTAIVSVDPNTGIATCVGAGTANVSVIDQGNSLTDTVAFTVSAAPPPVATALDLEYTLAASTKRVKR